MKFWITQNGLLKKKSFHLRDQNKSTHQKLLSWPFVDFQVCWLMLWTQKRPSTSVVCLIPLLTEVHGADSFPMWKPRPGHRSSQEELWSLNKSAVFSRKFKGKADCMSDGGPFPDSEMTTFLLQPHMMEEQGLLRSQFYELYPQGQITAHELHPLMLRFRG